MGFKAAIFDMDGTILDTLADIAASVNASLRRFGYPARTVGQVRTFVGNGALKLVERALPPGTDEAAIRAVLTYYRPYYETHAAVDTRPYDGIPEALAALREAGVRLAVVSNKPDPAAQALAARYFPGVFDAVLGARDGLPVKPAPALMREAMRLVGVRPDETVYVGDSDVDIETAKNAGTACLCAAWGFRDEAFLRAHGAAAVLRSPSELPRAILRDE